MKLRFTGTLYGDCKVKKKSSRDFRRCASLLIDDRLLMDATADLTDFIDFYGFPDLRQEICAVLISAVDPKLLSADTLLYLSRGRELSVYGPPEAAALLPPTEGLRFFPIRPFSMTDILDYKVFALPTDTPGEYNYAATERFFACRTEGFFLRRFFAPFAACTSIFLWQTALCSTHRRRRRFTAAALSPYGALCVRCFSLPKF